ncbi:SMP-30/gluconolaconase/LRE domain protein [Paenibacillus pectinilyticus]|uniref:SMP-30/gluconolaconase/LRE domain protein n=1 Tax=Paenibacillus pectinilyticus TaxID=512399 RepID=A0A1C1A4R3_9BACL|nr:SMP-30/gluconolactonase/LRE family protein [Paenibacillus pectinilyticus]OCT15480.1 SMP-30/gluconolaconase/LRE domain protein [Paenibacillus pectinilyticus]
MVQGNAELELVWDGKATLGEGPVWDHRTGQMIWVDIMGQVVHLFTPAEGTTRSIAVDQKVGAAVPREQGGMVVATEHGFHFLDAASGSLARIVDPESHLPNNRFNDGKCDRSGRFWAGTMAQDDSGTTGSLYCLDVDGSLRTVHDGGIGVSNGLGWSPDNKTMYYIDSPTKQVVAYAYDEETGVISDPRTVVTIPEGEGFPDGMSVDSEGMLWIAQWGGWQVGYWNPHTGEKLGSIPVPVERTSSCAFGGEQLDELYITTASVGIKEEEWDKQPNAGGLFRIKLHVKGAPANFYRG